MVDLLKTTLIALVRVPSMENTLYKALSFGVSCTDDSLLSSFLLFSIQSETNPLCEYFSKCFSIPVRGLGWSVRCEKLENSFTSLFSWAILMKESLHWPKAAEAAWISCFFCMYSCFSLTIFLAIQFFASLAMHTSCKNSSVASLYTLQ